MDFGDLIYVIIGLIWFIISIISASKKTKKQQAKKTGSPVSPTTQPPDDELKRALEEIFGGSETREKKSTSQPQEPISNQNRAPKKLEIKKKHEDFLAPKPKRNKKNLEKSKTSVSSFSSSPTLSPQNLHPPETGNPEVLHEIDVNASENGMFNLQEFDQNELQKLVIYSEIFNPKHF